MAELSAERTMLGLEAQAERNFTVWYRFPGNHDELNVIPRHALGGFTYTFYAGKSAGDVVRRSTAVRLLALAKREIGVR